MQGDFFAGFEEMKWEVLKVESETIVNPQSGWADTFVTYIHTRPIGWKGPEKSDRLPWEAD